MIIPMRSYPIFSARYSVVGSFAVTKPPIGQYKRSSVLADDAENKYNQRCIIINKWQNLRSLCIAISLFFCSLATLAPNLAAFELPFPESESHSSIINLIKAGDYERALTEIKEKQQIRAAHATTLYLKALALRALKQAEQAQAVSEELNWFNTKAEIEADLPFLLQAQLALDKADNISATNALNSALSLNPTRFETLMALAELSFGGADYKTSLIHLNSATQLQPSNFLARLMMAQALMHSGDRLLKRNNLTNAAKIVQELLSDNQKLSNSERTSLITTKVQVLSKLGEIELANKALKPLLKKEPSNPDILALRDQLNVEAQIRSSQMASNEKLVR